MSLWNELWAGFISNTTPRDGEAVKANAELVVLTEGAQRAREIQSLALFSSAVPASMPWLKSYSSTVRFVEIERDRPAGSPSFTPPAIVLGRPENYPQYVQERTLNGFRESFCGGKGARRGEGASNCLGKFWASPTPGPDFRALRDELDSAFKMEADLHDDVDKPLSDWGCIYRAFPGGNMAAPLLCCWGSSSLGTLGASLAVAREGLLDYDLPVGIAGIKDLRRQPLEIALHVRHQARASANMPWHIELHDLSIRRMRWGTYMMDLPRPGARWTDLGAAALSYIGALKTEVSIRYPRRYGTGDGFAVTIEAKDKETNNPRLQIRFPLSDKNNQGLALVLLANRGVNWSTNEDLASYNLLGLKEKDRRDGEQIRQALRGIVRRLDGTGLEWVLETSGMKHKLHREVHPDVYE